MSDNITVTIEDSRVVLRARVRGIGAVSVPMSAAEAYAAAAELIAAASRLERAAKKEASA